PPWRTNLGQVPGQFTGGFNVPYTAADWNNMFLAAIKADGTVLMPSFHRPWIGFGTLAPGNYKWTSDIGPAPANRPEPWNRYLLLRPRPMDHMGFPPPEDGGGDVKQLVGSPGTLVDGALANNDSFWMDLGFPVRKTPEGLK